MIIYQVLLDIVIFTIILNVIDYEIQRIIKEFLNIRIDPDLGYLHHSL